MKLAYADREWYYADPDFVGRAPTGTPLEGIRRRAPRVDRPERPFAAAPPRQPLPLSTRPYAVRRHPGRNRLPSRPAGDHRHARGRRRRQRIFGNPERRLVPPRRRLSRSGASCWAPGAKASSSMQPAPTISNPASVRERPSRRLWRSRTANLSWPGARPAETPQDRSICHFFLNVVEFGMDIQSALDAPLIQILDFPPSSSPAIPGREPCWSRPA